MPRDRNAPNDCPAEPVNLIVDGILRQPLKPVLLRDSLESIVPTVRFTFLIGRSSVTFFRCSIAGLAQFDQLTIQAYP